MVLAAQGSLSLSRLPPAMADRESIEARERRIAEANRADQCPQCGRPLGPERVGSGVLSDGIFCSLGCQTAFHEDYFRERARASNPSRN